MNKKVIIIMGVAGSGKTTVGSLLAKTLKIPFYDGDAFHPETNIHKMRRGVPLDDNDRDPWLRSLAELVSQSLSSEGAVIACSALKEKYRAILRGNHEEVLFVYLKATMELVSKRMINRQGHFMHPGLIESQFAVLEEPQDALLVSIEESPEKICEIILEYIKLHGTLLNSTSKSSL